MSFMEAPLMAAKANDVKPIPGTTIFDGKMAQKGYALNKMCYSFNDAVNREEFLKDEEAYCDKFGLTQEQKDAIKARNVLQTCRMSGHNRRA
jgi:protocatechuate 4,5-dioxygenase alpha chain